MALVLKDRVRETSTTSGTGTLTLGGAVLGFQGFSVIGNANTTYYAIVDVTTGAWEVGVGTYTLAGTTLSRTTVLESSTGGGLVSFLANIKDVFCTYPAEQAVTLDDVQTLTNKTLSSPTLVTPALGTPSSGIVTNLTGTASININGTVGATTPAAVTATTVTASGAVAGSNLSGTNTGDQTAIQVSNTPAGNIAATTVQAALNELDVEKMQAVTLAAPSGSSLVGYLPAGTGAVATTVQAKLRESVSVLDFGAVGNGSSPDQSACYAADAASVSVVYPAGVYYIAANTVLTKPIILLHGARFKVNAGVVLTLNGTVTADPLQYIFEGAAGAFAGTFGLVDLWVDWFGAVPDSTISASPGGTDSGVAINKAIVAANNGATRFGVVKLNSGVYKIVTPVVSGTVGVVIEGKGKYNTILISENSSTAITLVTMGGLGGPPSILRGLGVIARVGGSFSATGVNVTGNGTFVSDVWLSGFNKGIVLASTDVFLFDFASELSINGVLATASNINISNGTVYANQAVGLLVANLGAIEPGAVTVSNVRSTTDTQRGFHVTNSSNVIFDACSASHVNASAYSISAFSTDGSSNNVQMNNCYAVLGSVSTTSIGFDLLGAGNFLLTGCAARNFNKGAHVSISGNAVINGGMYSNNSLYGIHADGYNLLTISNAQCNYQGTGGASDAGIFVQANQANQRLLALGNLCATTGGGAQDYGIRVTCTNASSSGLVSNNVTAFNSVGGVVIDGANAANITLANNV